MDMIYKYELDVIDTQIIKMPQNAMIMSIQSQHGKGQIWAKVDPSFAMEDRTFNTYGTGHELTGDTCCYVGTYQIAEGNLVFHVFESHKQVHI